MVFSASQDSICTGLLDRGDELALSCHELCPASLQHIGVYSLPTHKVRAMGMKWLGTHGSVLGRLLTKEAEHPHLPP